VNSVATGRYCN